MEIAKTIFQIRQMRKELNGSVGFILTMGYLHDGHLELVRQAQSENDSVIVSIFVNPTQFGPHEDFKKYPRNTKRDLNLLRSANTTLLFLPSVAEMYPKKFQTFVETTEVSQGLEGARRPSHFRGVATVVTKLFNIVQPDCAYFGQKDAQQVAVIQQMVKDLAFPVEIKVVPTVRDVDGLALSSRNVYLNPIQRKAAPVLYHALMRAKELYEAGEHRPQVLHTTMLDMLHREPLANIDYVSVADAETLEELADVKKPNHKPLLLSMAVRIGTTRLIDNVVLQTNTAA